ncbi:AAA family ATPase [Patescibacteria group bacterium]|nr:AAA family ATPase [Patescibacteria group bacterium]
MFLQKLEMQGFKSFASKTTLTFIGSRGKDKGITTIVGPNGSGKSNVADGIRWVLGEQSLKLLRGKKSEDVIFSGSEKKSRSGFAEVTLLLNNEDGKADIEYPEIAITRRLYRDGESEYLVNGGKVRLQDIQLLLARANFGERHYSVIGQGMIDSILQLSAEERKDFFDEATGVKPFQIKKEQALHKLEQTEENLQRAAELIAEIEPRLRSLARQVKRLEERETLEVELHGLQHQYYRSLWQELSQKLGTTRIRLEQAERTRKEKVSEVNDVRAQFAGMEKEETRSDAVLKLQQEYQGMLEEKSRLRMRQVELEGSIAKARAVAAVAAPLPLTKIIQEIRILQTAIERAAVKIRTARTLEQAHAMATEVEQLAERSHSLAEKLERPPQEMREVRIDPAITEEISGLGERLRQMEVALDGTQKQMQDIRREEGSKKSAVFEAQRKLENKLAELRSLDNQENDIKVELARYETRRESLETEMAQELKERQERVRQEASQEDTTSTVSIPETQSRIQKLKYQLELIGGIDPEVVKEHTETQERFTFLTTHTEDLRKAITDLEKVIIELTKQIDTQFEEAFAKLSEDFTRFFKILFNGGNAKLEKRKEEPAHTPAEDAAEHGEELAEQRPLTLAEKFREETYTVEITANPPGKKVKSIAMLSGGERAMTAIALISAIISNNPSPFVVLDEVDAALDESNSIRFATIVDELSSKSQFIVITHNRYTMEKSAILYGVTMRDDGTSQVLSVSLEDIRTGKTPVSLVV